MSNSRLNNILGGNKIPILPYEEIMKEMNEKYPIAMERKYQTYWRGNWIFTLPFIMLLFYLFL